MSYSNSDLLNKAKAMMRKGDALIKKGRSMGHQAVDDLEDAVKEAVSDIRRGVADALKK